MKRRDDWFTRANDLVSHLSDDGIRTSAESGSLNDEDINEIYFKVTHVLPEITPHLNDVPANVDTKQLRRYREISHICHKIDSRWKNPRAAQNNSGEITKRYRELTGHIEKLEEDHNEFEFF